MGFPARIIPDVSWRKWGQPQIPNGGHTYSSYSIVSYYIPLDPITMHVSLIMYNIVYTYVYIYIIYIYPIASHIYIYIHYLYPPVITDGAEELLRSSVPEFSELGM